MAKQFEITSPDGKVYDVTAPDDATQEDAIAYVQQQISTGALKPRAAVSQPAMPKAEPVSATQAIGRGAIQGSTLGFGDEISGAVSAGLETISPSDPARADLPILDRLKQIPDQYTQYRDIERKENERVSAERPVLYGAGQVMGSIPTFALGGAGVARGVATGAAAGLGLGEGDLANQAASAALGGLAGGSVNKLAPYLKAIAPAGRAGAAQATKAAVKESAEWSGISGVSDLIKRGISDPKGLIKPFVTHTVPGGQAVAAAVIGGKSVAAGSKAAAKAYKERAMLESASRSAPGWASIVNSIRDTADPFKQTAEINQAAQTDPEVRKKLINPDQED